MRLVLPILLMAALFTPSQIVRADLQDSDKESDVTQSITDLSSDDGQHRVAATEAVFNKGKVALGPMQKAGAKQIAPVGTIGSRRLDVVYSLLAGFGKNPADGLSGYKTNSFGLHLEKGATEQDVIEMGRRHGFTLTETVTPGNRPACYVTLKKGKNLEAVVKAILTSEPSVVSINLNYFES